MRSYGVAPIDGDLEARAFCMEHHYSGSYPAARFRAGLYRARPFMPAELVGVAVFSEPAQRRAIPHWLRCSPSEGIELGRFVLLDDVEGNGESWFLARATRLLVEAKPELRRVLSYSDPVPKADASGRLVSPGHVGLIYQASNARVLGRSSRKREFLDARGRSFSARALSKIRNGERGAEAAERRFVQRGAPPRMRHEEGRAYVARALSEGSFVSAIHPGKIVYALGLNKRERRLLPSNPEVYPKKEEGEEPKP